MTGTTNTHNERTCCLCGRPAPRGASVRAETIRPQVAAHVAQHHPERWTGSGYVCRACLNAERLHFVTSRLTEERGALSAVEQEVAKKAGLHLTIARNVDAQFEENITFGQRAADTVARVGGSWSFVLSFIFFLVVWMAINVIVLRQPSFDPYPFILLNLVLSCLAALQAPSS